MAKPIRPEPKVFLKGDISMEEYNAWLFSTAPRDVIYWGEKSTSYYESAEVAFRMKQAIPDAMLIAMLRDPVDRALSNYHFSVQHELEDRSLKEVFLERKPRPKVNFQTSVDPFDYLGRGEYIQHLTPYRELFGDQLITIAHRGFSKKASVRKELLDRLGLDDISSLPVGHANASARKPDQDEEEVRAYLCAYYQPMLEKLRIEWNIDLDA